MMTIFWVAKELVFVIFLKDQSIIAHITFNMLGNKVKKAIEKTPWISEQMSQ